MKKGSISRHTFTLWMTSGLVAIASYLFFFAMARMLSQQDYGLLYSLIALLYIFSVPTETIRFVISKYVAIFKTKKEYGKIKNLFKRSFKKLFFYSLPALFLVIIIAPTWLSGFLHVDVWHIIVASLTIPFIFLLPIIHGTLQGLNRFVALGMNNSIEMILKLVIAVVLVFIGLGVYGAIVAIPLSVALAIAFGFIPLKKIMESDEEKVESSPIYKYFFPFLFVVLFLTAMSSVDVLIAKHFFSPIYAGFYAAISTLGTILFFISIAVTKVMFPLVAEKHHLKKVKEHKDLLYKSLLLILLPSALWVILLALFPKFIVGLILGSKYLAIANFIKYEAIAMGFLALSNVIALYNLAIDRKKFIFLPAVFCVLEIVLLCLFHNSLTQYLRILILVNVLLFLFLLVTSVKMREIKENVNKIKEHPKFKKYKRRGINKLKWLRMKKKKQKSKKKEKNQTNQLKKF